MGPLRPARPRGYTLIEVLVVIAVLAVVVISASAAVRFDPHARLTDEAQRLASAVAIAYDHATHSGERVALDARPDGYGFWLRGPGGAWRAADGTSLPVARQLPEGMTIAAVSLNGAPVAPGRRIVLHPDDPPALALEIGGGGHLARLRTDATGTSIEVAIDAPGAPQ